MSYVVLARKWRPQTFEDLIGQEHVSRTLAGAIARDRVAHAFLFTGVRGVGKTSSARILAKALNCAKGPTVNPCLECSACKEIGEGVDVDVQEIDGASYTGVDAVRSLQETIPYRPQRDRFKIFIVDEVHMLSTAAWNAFLKTLEEPPPHVKFIFATTEVNKVPVTILSRCQRYDFKLIRTGAIADRLRYVLDQENVKADDGALRIVAREAAGSMRDAMSLLDQVIAWTGDGEEGLTGESVARVLGVAARQVLHDLGAAVLAGEASRCLDIVAHLAEQGLPLSNVARDFLEHLRCLVVAKVSENPGAILELADEELADVQKLVASSEADDLSRVYLGFSRAYDDIARSAQVRGAFEMALVRLSQRPPLVPLDDLLRRLAALEHRLATGDSGGGGGGGGGGGAGRREEPRPRAQGAPPPRQEERRAETTPTFAAPAPAPQPKAPAAPAPRPKAPAAPAPRPKRSEPAWQPPPAVLAAARAAPATAPSAPIAPADPLTPPAPAWAEPAPPVPKGPAPRALGGDALDAWEAILASVRQSRPQVASIFEHGSPVQVDREAVVVAFEPSSFLAEQASKDDVKANLEEAARAHFGDACAVSLDTSGRHREVQTLAAKNSAEAAARLAEAKRKVAEHPLVVAARELLGGELRDVRLPPDAAQPRA